MSDREKLEKLKEEIADKYNELHKELLKAQKNNDESVVNAINDRQLQCVAQIRLINYILSDFSDKNYIIC